MRMGCMAVGAAVGFHQYRPPRRQNITARARKILRPRRAGIRLLVDLASRNEERFALVFQLCPVPLALTGEQGRITEANPALGRLLGVDPAELAGRRLLDFTHADDREASAAVGGGVLSGDDGAATLDKRYVAADGRTVHARVTMLVFDAPAGTSRKLTQIEDVTG